MSGTPELERDPSGEVKYADEQHRAEIAIAWAEASQERHRANVAEAWSRTNGAALDLAEAQIAHVLTIHVDTTHDRTCDECGYTYPCRTVQILHGEENGT